MKARLMVRSKPAKGQHRLKIKAQKVGFEGGDFHVFVETDVGSDLFEEAGALQQKGDSAKGHFSRDLDPAGVSYVFADLYAKVDAKNPGPITELRPL
jgi:hypothetical protein